MKTKKKGRTHAGHTRGKITRRDGRKMSGGRKTAESAEFNAYGSADRDASTA